MFDVKFTIDGRQISPHKMGKELEKAMLEDIKKKISDKVRRIRCPEHGQTARVTSKGHNINQLSWKVEGCCEELIESVKKAIS